MSARDYDSRYSGDVEPDNTNARRAHSGPTRYVTNELCRRVEDHGATLANIEEAIDRGHYSIDRVSDIALQAKCFGGIGGSVVAEAAIAVLGDMLEDKTPAQLDAELLKYWR